MKARSLLVFATLTGFCWQTGDVEAMNAAAVPPVQLGIDAANGADDLFHNDAGDVAADPGIRPRADAAGEVNVPVAAPPMGPVAIDAMENNP